jgi:signal transduction histidine kinase/ActR/RegA family two-component response regulator
VGFAIEPGTAKDSLLFPQVAAEQGMAQRGHCVQFYEQDSFLVKTVVSIIGNGLGAGDAGVVITTASHLQGIEERLLARGLDLDKLRAQGRYVALDAANALDTFIIGGMPDESLFRENIAQPVMRAAQASPRRFARAFGEMVSVLWVQGNRDGAFALEDLWSNLLATGRFSLCCAYSLRDFSKEAEAGNVLGICRKHVSVIPAESYTELPTDDARQRSIAYLQYRARVLEDELKLRKEEAAAADRQRNEFLAMLGHELRNPLSAVLNALSIARRNEVRQESALEIASRQGVQLSRLVDDLLDAGRIAHGRIELRKEPVVLGSVVRQAVRDTRFLVQSRRHELVLSIEPDIRVEADPARLCQIVHNLIDNAAKFTAPGGRIEVTVRRNAREGIVCVRDSGAGIAAAMLPRVFDLFTRAEDAPGPGGLGVGLALVKRLAEMHGGQAAVRSKGPGCGAEFEVRLPILPPGAAVSTPVTAAPPASRGARVLVVEDNPDARESLVLLLESFGHSVLVVADGTSAVQAFAAGTFDAVLVDIGLPGLDGYEVARRIRALPDAGSVVLAALTGYGLEEHRWRAFSSGFNFHLTKPANMDILQAILTAAAENVQSGRDAGA